MYCCDYTIRIRYGETDQMGMTYHGNYAAFLEAGRTEMFRELGLPYAEMEKSGVILPVIELKCRFIKPVFYDEIITVKSFLKELPKVKLHIHYEIYNEHNTLVHQAETTLAFLNAQNKKPCRAPKQFIKKVKPYFE